MRFRQIKYSLLSLIVSFLYWIIDSSIHYFFYRERTFEFIPSGTNELWMRNVIIVLVLVFGVYVDISVKRIKGLYDERYQLQLRLDEALTKLLGGYLPICSICKKVKIKEGSSDKDDVWKSIDSYISEHTDMEFTHGYCPECSEKAMLEIRNMDK